jgi:hypothetical protein
VRKVGLAVLAATGKRDGRLDRKALGLRDGVLIFRRVGLGVGNAVGTLEG